MSQFLVQIIGARRYVTVMSRADDTKQFMRDMRYNWQNDLPVTLWSDHKILINSDHISAVSGPNDPEAMLRLFND